MFSDPKHNPLGRFDGLGATYARHRPSYPAQAINWVVEKITDRARPVADIGAGTGILSRLLVERGLRVIGIEPNESMRDQAGFNDLIEYRSGQAEATHLESASVAAVVAAQTFHWCDAGPALQEFHRILIPNGWVTLMWNDADLGDPFSAGFWRILRQGTPEPEIVARPHHLAGEPLLVHPLFQQGEVRTTPNVQEMDEEGLLGRAFSASFAPKECGASQRFADQLRALCRQHERDGRVRLRYRTILYQARRSSQHS
ncbi:MAG: methyltransferase domain-containing protein [Planctomycetes bacterium]|nr:methyltransferase domain-containing protein [Planctomycetota bacterium]